MALSSYSLKMSALRNALLHMLIVGDRTKSGGHDFVGKRCHLFLTFIENTT